jgi:hypothetical protein
MMAAAGGSNSNCRIRERYLNRLGIFPNSPPSQLSARQQPIGKRSPIRATLNICKRDRHSPRILKPHGCEVAHEDNRQESLGGCKRRNTRPSQVQFHGSVSVLEIPHYRDYDKDSRQKMWGSARVLEQNAQRNLYEFQADGRDWRRCKEEEDMILTRKGHLVHPATWKLILENLAQQTRPTAYLRRRR